MNDQPPTEIHVWRPEYVDFSPVKRLYNEAALASIGVIWKVDGSKEAKAKFMWVKPFRFKSSGETAWHIRVFAHDS